jgi:hypothetical protein
MKYKTSRRNFLKTTAAGATGLMVSGVAGKPNAPKSAWFKGKQINRAIDNLRVVCCYDEEITTGNIGSTFSTQNSVIDADRVAYDLDLMATYLAQTTTASEAWTTIFQQPSGKQWSEVKVAFKVNCIYPTIMHHIAIIDKLCKVLNSFGVPYANMIIYDGCHNATGSGKYTSYVGNGLDSAVIVSDRNDALGGTTSVTIPGGDSYSCTKDIADGIIDILINCAVNKGHGSTYGSCTLTQKNHIGTIKYSCPSSVTDMTNINSCDAIIGGTLPRQQLCLIDSIVAAVSGPTQSITHNPHRIVMGTFGAAVDFLTVHKIREPIMNASHNTSNVKNFLSNHDYTDQEIQDLIDLTPEQNDGKGWLEFDPNTVGTIPKKTTLHDKQTITFTIKGSQFKTVTKKVSFNYQTIKSASIMDVKGRTIRNLSIPATGRKTILWDGRNEQGKMVRSGRYILNIRSSKSEKAVSFTLQK